MDRLVHFGGYLDDFSQIDAWLRLARYFRDPLFLFDFYTEQDQLALVLSKDPKAEQKTEYGGELPYIIAGAFSSRIREAGDISLDQKVHLVYQHLADIFQAKPVNFNAYGSKDNPDFAEFFPPEDFVNFEEGKDFDRFMWNLMPYYKEPEKYEYKRRESFFSILYRPQEIQFYSYVMTASYEPYFCFQISSAKGQIKLLMPKQGTNLFIAGAITEKAGTRTLYELENLEENLEIVQEELQKIFRSPPYNIRAYNYIPHCSSNEFLPLEKTPINGFWPDSTKFMDHSARLSQKHEAPKQNRMTRWLKRFI
jgi:hypothetical protein